MKKSMWYNFITKHIEEYSSLYIFHTVLFLMGVIFGAIVVNSLSLTQKEDLFYFINEFFAQVVNGETVDAKEVFIHSFSYNSKFIGLMWVLGISMIGLPVISILLFLKGMVIGFTIGFLVQQMGWKGFFISFVRCPAAKYRLSFLFFIAVAVIPYHFLLQMIKKLFVKMSISTLCPDACPLLLWPLELQFLFTWFCGFYRRRTITPYFMKGFLSI